LNKKLMQSEVV